VKYNSEVGSEIALAKIFHLCYITLVKYRRKNGADECGNGSCADY
jgi:hypothetical protein